MQTKKLDDLNKEELIALVKKLKKRKKYGLVWEEKPEDVVEQCKRELPVLEQIEDRKIEKAPDAPTNLIIEGDNYHALSVLNYTHAGKVDVIYIDPPYNTGAKDWKYNNNYVDINDSYRHSKWLSLMSHRLQLAKNLLKKDGLLIVAIDDNEAHRLRALIEEVMPAYDVTSVTIVQNPRGNITSNFARTHEYALFVIPRGISLIARTKKENTSPRKLRRWGHNSTRTARPTMFYPIYVKDGKISRIGIVPDNDFHPKSKNIVKKNGEIEVWPIDQNGIERRWNFGLDRIRKELNRMTALTVKEQIDIFLTQEDTTPKTVWTDPDMEAGRHGATLVKTITGTDFPFPKSIFNVKRCLELIVGSRPNALVLDFFAGSGTTGHAVLMLNEEDDGNRQFILCTNNENKIAENVTYPRIKGVIKGYAEESGIPANLRYFKTEFVKRNDVSDDTRRELVKRSTEMICVRENTFTKKHDNKKYKIYSNGKIATGILFDLDGIDELKEKITNIGLPAQLYVFSLTNDSYPDDFADLSVKHKLCPIPESILEVYRKLFA